jgi:hypothetical protein
VKLDGRNSSRINFNSIGNNIKNLPFQFGIEIGKSLRLDKNGNYINYGIIGYVDINLHKNLIYLKIEGGSINVNDRIKDEGEDYNRNAGFLSLGLNYNFIKANRNRLYLHGCLSVYGNDFLPVLSGNITFRYVYVFNEIIGISSSVRLPFVHNFNPVASFGIQLFNN